MSSSKVKTFAIVFALFLLAGFVTVGCKQKTTNAMVNTNSMPGQTFAKHGNQNVQQNNSTIVYLGSDSRSRSANFGPKDMSFEFENLK